MFGIFNKLNEIKNERLRDTLLITYCTAIVLVVSAIVTIPLLFLLYYVANYVVIPLLFFMCGFIPWLIEGGKQ